MSSAYTATVKTSDRASAAGAPLKTSSLFSVGTGIDWTPALTADVDPLYLFIHSTGSMVSAQTLSIYLKDTADVAYKTLIYQETLAIGVTDKFLNLAAIFPNGIGNPQYNALEIVLTNTGTPAVTVYMKLVTS